MLIKWNRVKKCVNRRHGPCIIHVHTSLPKQTIVFFVLFGQGRVWWRISRTGAWLVVTGFYIIWLFTMQWYSVRRNDNMHFDDDSDENSAVAVSEVLVPNPWWIEIELQTLWILFYNSYGVYILNATFDFIQSLDR